MFNYRFKGKIGIPTLLAFSVVIFIFLLGPALFASTWPFRLKGENPGSGGGTMANVKCAWSSAPAGFEAAINAAARRTDKPGQPGLQPALLAAIVWAEHPSPDRWPNEDDMNKDASTDGPFQIKADNWENWWKAVKELGYSSVDVSLTSRTNVSDAALATAASLMNAFQREGIPPNTTEEKFIVYVGMYHNRGPVAARKWARDLNYDLNRPPENTENRGWEWGATDTAGVGYAKRVWNNFQTLQEDCVENPNGQPGEDLTDAMFLEKYTFADRHAWCRTQNPEPEECEGSHAATKLADRITTSKTSNLKVRDFYPGTRKPSGIVFHVTADDKKLEPLVQYLYGKTKYVHLWIDQDGSIYKLLPFNIFPTAGSGEGSRFAIGVEMRSISNNGTTEAQLTSAAKIVKWFNDKYGVPKVAGNHENLIGANPKGIYGHYQTQCSFEKQCSGTSTPKDKDGKDAYYKDGDTVIGYSTKDARCGVWQGGDTTLWPDGKINNRYGENCDQAYFDAMPEFLKALGAKAYSNKGDPGETFMKKLWDKMNE